MKTSHGRNRRHVASAIVVVLSVLGSMLLGAVASPASAAVTPLASQSVNGTVGVPATSVALDVSTLVAPISYSITGDPAPLAFDTATGLVSGTPLTPTAAPVIVTVTAANAVNSVTSDITINVVPAPPPIPTLVPSSQPAIVGTIGLAIGSSQTLAPTDFVNAPVLTVAPALPAWLTFDAATGVISGASIPTAAFPATDFTITATDGAVTATSVVSISVTTPTVTPSAAAFTAPVGGAFSPALSFTPVGFPAAPTYTLAPTPALPPGVTFTPAGALVGSPTSAWPTKTYTVTATSTVGAATATAQTTLSLTVSTGTLAPATQSIVTTVGTTASTPAYAAADLLAAGLLAPVTFSITPALPTGLLFSTSTGAITGKPTVGTVLTAHTVTATDTNGATATAIINVTVTETQLDPPVIYVASAGTTSGSLRVLFTSPLNAPIGQLYSLEVYDSSGASLVKTVKPFTALTEVTGLTPGATYSVIVVAEASAGYLSSKSVPRNGVASSATGRLTAPVITTISGGTAVGTITVAFTPSANAPAGQTYSAQVYDEDQVTLIKSVKGSSPITITGLTPGVTYYVVVVAEASANFLESPSRGRTAVATANKATATTVTTQNTATATGITPSAANVATARALGAGWYLVTPQQAAKAKKVILKKTQALSIKPKLAPSVNVRAGKVISLRIRGLAANAQIVADVKLLKKWTPLGTARTNAKGKLILPAFQATTPGRFVIRLSSITGVPTYLAVIVKAKP